MKKCMLILAAVLSFIAAAGYTASLVTNYWTIKSLKLQSDQEFNIGLFDRGCVKGKCLMESELADDDNISWKVAAGGIIAAGVFSLIASVILIASSYGKKSTGAKVSGILLLFPVVFTIAGVVVYVYFELQHASNKDHNITFGYSLYTSCGAGAMSFLASIIAFVGS